jgi:hypothetical protein
MSLYKKSPVFCMGVERYSTLRKSIKHKCFNVLNQVPLSEDAFIV